MRGGPFKPLSCEPFFTAAALGLLIALAAPARAWEDWQRLLAVRTPTLDVTLLRRHTATSADPLFVGWELHNKTSSPSRIGDGTK